MKVNGKIIFGTVSGNKCGLMVPSMKDNGSIIKQMEKEHSTM